jgi:uncharacterized protein (UPF0264 family)
MARPVDRIARSAAARLAQDANLPWLIPEVERQLAVGDSGQAAERYEPITISLAALVVSIAGLAWTVYTDLRRQTPRPDPEVIKRRIRVQVELPEQVSAADRDRILAVIVEETLAETPDAE